MDKSQEIFEKACRLMPGGVSSPVRAFRAVGMTPRFIERAKGSHIYDVDGHDYIDYIGSWGPMILGHAHPEVVEAVCGPYTGEQAMGRRQKGRLLSAK